MFLWCLAHSVFSFRGPLFRLFSQDSPDSSLCPLCSEEPETVEHLFIRCNVASTVWRKSFWLINVSNMGFLSIHDFVKMLVCPPRDRLRTPLDQWNFTPHASIWFTWNSVIHKNLVFGRRCYLDHLQAWKDDNTLKKKFWQPLDFGCLKCDIDVTIRERFSALAVSF